MFHQSFISAASAFPFSLQTSLEQLSSPRSPFTKDGVFLYPPLSPSCSSGGIPSPRLISPSLAQQAKKSSFTIEAILGLKNSSKDNDDVFHPRLQLSPQSAVKEPLSAMALSAAAAAAAGAVTNSTSVHAGVKRKSSESRSKAKRIRTIFTPEQLERLEAEFERQQYMVGPERLYLAASLNLSEAQVKVWFQNRRIKWRKTHLEQQQQRLVNLRKNSASDDHESEVAEIDRPSTEGESDEEKEFDYDPWLKAEQDPTD